MSILLVAIATFIAADKSGPASAVFEGQSARIRVEVVGGQYTYSVTNLDNVPIVRFEIGQRRSYKPEGPRGWQAELSKDAFVARAADAAGGILPKWSGSFRMRVSSAGAVLGESTARVVFSDGRQLSIPSVWSPRAPSRLSVLFPSLVAAAVILIHGLWVYRQRRGPLAT